MDNCQTIWSYVFALSIRWAVCLSVFVLCEILGLLLNVLFIHLYANYWVNGCGTELKNSLGMAILIENKITFVFVLDWIIIVLMMVHQMCSFLFAHCTDGRLHFGRCVLVQASTSCPRCDCVLSWDWATLLFKFGKKKDHGSNKVKGGFRIQPNIQDGGFFKK